VEVIPELEFYFEKFIYTYDPNVVIFPEYDFTLFIMSYFVSKGSFEGSDIEKNVIEYFGVCKTNLIASHYAPFVDRLNNLATPELYVSYMIKKSRSRFENLRGAIEFIDAYKRLVAEDMQDVLLSKIPNAKMVKKIISSKLKKDNESVDSEDMDLI
ncbi:uncharacterized protein VICG_01482, partial [Vittaforma corneae ATCC 50505]